MTWLRRVIQGAFLCLVLVGVFVVGGHVEAWCPFGGVEAAGQWLREGSFPCSLGVINFFAFGGVVLSALLLRRAFCGYLCPLGTMFEASGKIGAWLRLPRLRVPRAADRVLSLLKYGVAAGILYATWRMGELVFRGFDPCYALISRHGEDITAWSYVALGGTLGASMLFSVPFCRWLCPLAAVMAPFSRAGVTRVWRDADACTSCAKCARVCPMAIPVDRLPEVTVPRCTACLRCVEACPPIGERRPLAWGPPGRRWPGMVVPVVLGIVAAAVVAVAYAAPVPSFVRERGEKPSDTAVLELRVRGVTCRGASTRLTYFLMRDDVAAVPGYLKLEAWPGPGFVRVRVTYDPEAALPEAIKDALIEPYWEPSQGGFHRPPFEIENYAPWR